ncbi:NUDIX domain-containing protein [Puteibacter caeruleilacunae]|nr:NUDIX domain-containing protein [Puteibacter caeruleilacunae]
MNYSQTHPRNVIKYCPKCGSTAFNWREDFSFHCEQCKFKLFINSSSAVAAIIVNGQGEILFSRRAINPHKGMLDLPGGFIDPGENAENALTREIKEELGSEVTSYKYIGSFPNVYPYGGINYYTLDMVYLCTLERYDNLVAMDDISAIEFIDPVTMDINELGAESMKNIITFYNNEYNK